MEGEEEERRGRETHLDFDSSMNVCMCVCVDGDIILLYFLHKQPIIPAPFIEVIYLVPTNSVN